MAHRAFSLVIVLVLGVAAVVVATTLLVAQQAAAVRAAHTLQSGRAEAIAEAGMARLRSHLKAITTIDGDFDLVLDVDGEANCVAMPGAAATVPAVNQTLRPKMADGTRVVYRGKAWTRVAYDGGAYMMRFEDDNDDFRPQASWATHTGNTLNGAANCREGDVALGDADNPFRDRNQTISLVVMGIMPGTDPNKAVHRSTLRRIERLGGNSVVAGIQVDGNINLSGNASLDACSPVGSMLVDGNLTQGGSSDGCACGESRADSITGAGWTHCTATAGRCGTVGCAAGTLDVPGPNVPTVLALTSPAGKDFYFDWSKPCIFNVDEARGGLWFWDATALRGPLGVACSAVEGSAGGFPPITPNSTANFGQCWTPLLLGLPGGSGGPVSVFPGEISGSDWTPINAPSLPVTVGTVNGMLTTNTGYALFPGGTPAFTKPDWATACTVTYLGDPARSCTNCDGATVAMRPESGHYWFSGDTTAELHAIPAGTYFWNGNLSFTGAGADHSAPLRPGGPLFETLDLDDWPLMTIAVKGNVDFQTTTILGIGQRDAAFASVILEGNFSFSGGSNKHIAGSVWSTGNWNWNGASDNFLYGELHLNGNWDLGGNGKFRWRYLNALSAASASSAPTTPTQHHSLD